MKVKTAFTDRDTGYTYQPGDIYAGTPERITELREADYLTKTDVPEQAAPAAEPAPPTRKARTAPADE